MAFVKLPENAFSEAEREFKRSIELNPNYPTAHHWYSNYLRGLGRYDEALVEIRRARELDPRSLIINATLGAALCDNGKNDEGIKQLKNTLEMDPTFKTAHNFLGNAYTKKKMYDEALLEYERGMLIRDPATLPDSAPYLYAVWGKRDEALRACERLKKQLGEFILETLELAEIYAALGEKDQAFELLRTCQDVAVREPGFAALIKSDSKLENLRSDPRFGEMMRRLGLSQ
jgi:tetratricopeptide (TPR) repeat protein